MNRLLNAFERFDRIALSSIFVANPDILEYENSDKAFEAYLAIKRRTHALKISIEFVCDYSSLFSLLYLMIMVTHFHL